MLFRVCEYSHRTSCPIGRDCISFSLIVFFLSAPRSLSRFLSCVSMRVWSEILLFVSVHWRNNQHQPHMFLQTSFHSVDHYCYSLLCPIEEEEKKDERLPIIICRCWDCQWHETQTAAADDEFLVDNWTRKYSRRDMSNNCQMKDIEWNDLWDQFTCKTRTISKIEKKSVRRKLN